MRFWQTAVGLVLSTMVTVPVQVALLLLLSVAVRVTVVAPTLEQVKEDISIEVEATEQLSEEPPSTSPEVMVAFPDASR